MFLRLINILFLVFAVHYNITSTESIKKNNSSDLIYIQQFHKIFKQINQDYVKEPDKQKMIDFAIEGMLSSLDPHSNYFTDEDLEDFLNHTKGEFGGIGLEVCYDNGAIKVISPIDDLPAYKIGIKAGDYIVGVNDEFVSTLGFNKSVKAMRGKPGSKVKLLIIKKGTIHANKVELIRTIIKIIPVKYHLENGNIGYIRITAFNEHTVSEFKKSIKSLKNKSNNKMIGIILDLRNNPGGLLDQAIRITEQFIDSGVIVSTKGKNKQNNFTYKSNKSTNKILSLPLVVLINSGSASAAEIVAGALQDHKRAIIVGTRSFGKGSVQSFSIINSRSAIKLTTSTYYTPNGRSIQAEGIEPDIVVEMARIKYPETKNITKRFSESSLKNYIKNNALKLSNNSNKNTFRSKIKNNINQMSNLYKYDYQFARAYDLIIGLNNILKLYKT